MRSYKTIKDHVFPLLNGNTARVIEKRHAKNDLALSIFLVTSDTGLHGSLALTGIASQHQLEIIRDAFLDTVKEATK